MMISLHVYIIGQFRIQIVNYLVAIIVFIVEYNGRWRSINLSDYYKLNKIDFPQLKRKASLAKIILYN